jgi:hypothetical protein
LDWGSPIGTPRCKNPIYVYGSEDQKLDTDKKIEIKQHKNAKQLTNPVYLVCYTVFVLPLAGTSTVHRQAMQIRQGLVLGKTSTMQCSCARLGEIEHDL